MTKVGGKSQWIGGLALLASVMALIFVATYQSGPDRRSSSVSSESSPEPVSSGMSDGPIGSAKPGFANVGGVFRPETDVRFAEPQQSEHPKPLIDPGFSPPVAMNANPQVASVAAALKDRQSPERFSSFVQPAAFDRAAWEEDPDAYLSIVEPGRVYQSAEPGSDVTVIQAMSRQFQRVKQGDQIPLVVQAEPGAPVTFTSFDLGYFENQLTSTTVRTNANGEARVLFTAGKGTIDDIEILAASPLTTGQVRFVVNVKL